MTTHSIDANSFLMAGGIPSAKFPTPGSVVTGTIVDIGEPQQQTDFTSGAAKYWEDGKPMMQLPITVQTGEQDDDDDDGKRRLFVKGSLQKALRDAIRAAGADGIKVGGELVVTYTGDAPPKQRGMNGAKQYTVVYEPPASKAANDFLGTTDTTPATAAAAAAAPTAKPVDNDALAAALANLGPDAIAALAAKANAPA